MTAIVSDTIGLVVPPSVPRRAGIKVGDEVEFRVSRGVISIVPKALPDVEYTQAQRRALDRELAKGLEDIRQGRVEGPFASYPEFISSLHSRSEKPVTKRTKRPAR